LKSQSNPHFLFNTLNLITAEISTDPNRARETVFDLADLLRSSIKLAEERLVSVTEEMHLVSLYLNLQQRRFRDRLTFSIEIDPRTAELQIPSLLLQPVVENTIKWAVAPYADPASIEIATRLCGGRLSIVVKDSGPAFDEDKIVEGNGFRILRRTLDLQYQANYQLSLSSTADGGVFSLDLPAAPSEGGDA
jgi:LytS/YehU family sensor histidine kinase